MQIPSIQMTGFFYHNNNLRYSDRYNKKSLLFELQRKNKVAIVLAT